MTPTELIQSWHKWCEAHQIDNLSCGMATRKLVEMIDEHMSQKVEINDTSKEHVARNDMKEIANKTWKLCITEIDVPMVFDSKFKTWTDKCKNHIAAALEVAEQPGEAPCAADAGGCAAPGVCAGVQVPAGGDRFEEDRSGLE